MVFRSGVGTQMLIASASLSTSKLVDACRRPALTSGRQALARDVRNVGLGAPDALDFRRVDVDGGDDKAGLGELDGQRKPDVPEADDSDLRAFRSEQLDQGLAEHSVFPRELRGW